jgi:hypothetical protein
MISVTTTSNTALYIDETEIIALTEPNANEFKAYMSSGVEFHIRPEDFAMTRDAFINAATDIDEDDEDDDEDDEPEQTLQFEV